MFDQLLRWIYVEEVDEGAIEAFGEHLLMGANRYELGGLKFLMETKLCEGLSIENVATRLVLGEQAEADQLKESCLEFIKPNAAAVMATEGWARVASDAPLLNEVMAFIVGAATGNKGKKRTAEEAGLTSEQQEEVEARQEHADVLEGAAPRRRNALLRQAAAPAIARQARPAAAARMEDEALRKQGLSAHDAELTLQWSLVTDGPPLAQVETPHGDPPQGDTPGRSIAANKRTESLRRLEKRIRRFAITADHRGRLKSATNYEHPPRFRVA